MAEVFLAREPLAHGLAKILVIKKIHPALAEAPQFRQMFEDEAKIAVNLNHPNIVQTFGYGQIGPTYYLAMEHVEGVDLLRVLNAAVESGHNLPHGLSAYLGQQVAKALDYAHRKTDEYGQPLGIVHRDVSPQNILVSWDGMVKLVDFGIARARHVREEEGVVKGKFAYMSPEQAMGQPVDRRADIFATGVVLWELCCGRSLFGNLKGTLALAAIKTAEVVAPRTLMPSVPAELEAIILKCLARRPEDRYQTARDLHRALGQFFFALSSKEGQIFESGAMAGFLAQVLPAEPPPTLPVATQVPAPRPTLARSGREREQNQLLQPAERKSVLVVEGELAGLAALRRNLGEARAREALLDFLRITEHVAYKHQAHADRLDEGGFTFVLGLPAGAEDDAARAIALSRTLVDTLDGIARDLTPPLRLAIGICRGGALVFRAEGERFGYELVGDTAVIARRLAQEALPGEILVDDGVSRTARADWRFEELEAIGGASASEPASVHEGAPRARVHRLLGPRPRAERMADSPLRPLVGRDRELHQIDEVYRAVVAERRARYLLVLGDAGVGKASIVDRFRRRLATEEHLVLRAIGRPSLREAPYAMVADLTRDLLHLSEEAEPRQVKRQLDATLAPLFDPAEERPRRQVSDALGQLLGVKVGADELDPLERRYRLHAALEQLLARLAQARTLIVVLEGLHWADSQSLRLLMDLVEQPLDRPVLGIVTARHDDRMDELLQSGRLTPILVGELSPREREELVQQRLADPTEARPLIRQILDRAGGNPFYLHELIESLVERGVLQPTPDGRLRWVKHDEALSVPSTIEAVVAARLDRLPDDERETIRRAALLGRLFRVEDLQALSGAASPEALCRVLVRLAARGLLAPSAPAGDVYGSGPAIYAFRNNLTKEVAYAGLPPEARALYHSVAADRLVHSPAYRPGADDARLAEHLLAAGDRVAAGLALLSAGIYARDHAGNGDAFTLFSRALDLFPPEAHDERGQVHAEREEVLRAWGKRPAQLREVHAMRRQARALGGAVGRRREAEAYCRLGLLYLDVGRHAAARRELDRALALAQEAGERLVESEALRLCATLSMNIGEIDEALRLGTAALAVVGEPVDREHLIARAQALNTIGNLHVHTGRLREGLSAYAEGLVIYRRLGARRLEAATLNNMGWVFVGLGEYEEALHHYRRSLRLAQELGDRAGIGIKLANIGQTYTDLGDFARARRYLDKAVALQEALGDQAGLADALISLAQLSLREGRPEEAAAPLERGLALATESHNRYQEIRALVYLALCRLQGGGPPDEALALAQAATQLGQTTGIANGEVYGLWAEALALLQAARPTEALARATLAVARLDAGRDVDSPEEILFIQARAAAAAGASAVAAAALGRAYAEVQRKAELLRDPEWRSRYLAARPACEIVAAARAADGDL